MGSHPTPSTLDLLLDDAADRCTDAAAHLRAEEEMLASARSRIIDVGHIVQSLHEALGDIDRALRGCLDATAETASLVGHPERRSEAQSVFGALRDVRAALPRRVGRAAA